MYEVDAVDVTERFLMKWKDRFRTCEREGRWEMERYWSMQMTGAGDLSAMTTL